ncbi:hypothetical protein QYF61_019725 [Mycteria americana]|uniref:Uncharacterized protein n=1 Tax=Mycteria americana TaxID=33587 RepID=A0AAN7P983_MYCAM|nr:hypothetical protein QYF61_019725 [Mycteria americana]
MQGWNQEDQHSDGVETGEECERQQGLHRYSTNKRKTKDRVSPLPNRDGDEVTKGTEKHEILSSLARSPLRAPTLLRPHSGGKKYYQCQRKTKLRTNGTYKQGNIYIQDLQELTNVTHLWKVLGKWSSSPVTGENQMSHSLTSVLGKIMWQFLLKAISKYTKDKKVTGKSQHRFSMDRYCLTNLIAFCDEMTSSVDKRRAVDVVYLNYVAFYVVFNSIHEAVLGKYEGSR